MFQVVYRIPMTVAGLPLWVVLLILGGGAALALWLLARRTQRADLADSLRVISKGVAVVAVGAAAGAYYAHGQNWFPDGVPIYGFGMMLFLAFILCTWLGGRRGEYEGISKETIQDLAIWIFGGGLLGARLTFLLVERPTPINWAGWKEWLLAVPRIWDGGIVLYGSVIGGAVAYFVAYYFIFRKKGVQTRRFADAVAPTIALGLMLGRMGCFLNGCCFGGVTCAECGMTAPGVGFPLSAPPRDSLVRQGDQTVAGFTLKRIGGHVTTEIDQVDPNSAAGAAGLQPGDDVVKLNGQQVRDFDDLNRYLGLGNVDGWQRGRSSLELTVQRGAEQKTLTFTPRTLPLYPTQLYEVISMGLLMLLLFAYERFRRNPGQVAAVLMVCYGIHRFLNEILRDDPRPVGFERYGSVILVAGGVLLWSWLQWYKTPDAPVEPVGDAAKKAGAETPASADATHGAAPAMPGP